VRAYKFLRSGRIAPFSGVMWPAPGDQQPWLIADAIAECRAGVHACRVEDLPYWVGEKLWEVELGGDVIEAELKLVASRGRLLRSIDAWPDGVAARFARDCVLRIAHHAAAELEAAGLAAEAKALAAASETGTIRSLAQVAAAAAQAAAGDRRAARRAGHLAEYVVDATEWIDDAAGVAYVAAHAADRRSSPESGEDPFASERAHQARWLAGVLGLADDRSSR
jgi:hypothetical protein